MSNPRSQRGRGGDSSSEKPSFTQCGKNHEGKSLKGMDGCHGCLNSGHKVTDCPMAKAQGMESNQAQATNPNFCAPKKNRFYALRSRGDQKDSPDVVTGMLQIFSINVYELINPCATLSFMTPFWI